LLSLRQIFAVDSHRIAFIFAFISFHLCSSVVPLTFCSKPTPR